MENIDYYPNPNPKRDFDDPITTMLKWGAIGLGIAWLLNNLFENMEGSKEDVNTDTIDVEGCGEQPTAMETKVDDGDQNIATYGDLAHEIEKLSRQIEVLSEEIEKLKSASRNPNGGFNEDGIKKLAKIVFDQKVLRDRLAKLLDKAV